MTFAFSIGRRCLNLRVACDAMPSLVVSVCASLCMCVCMWVHDEFVVADPCFVISGRLLNAVCFIQQSKCQYCLLDESQRTSFCRREVCMVQLPQQRVIPIIFADKNSFYNSF